MSRSVLRGIAIILAAAVIIVVMFLLPSPQQKPRRAQKPNLDPWVLVSYDPDNEYGTYLGNGFISTRIIGEGVGNHNGKPLPCYMAGLYVDEKLIPVPTWSDLRFYHGKDEFKIDRDEPYKQALNMRTGILTTSATWRAGGKELVGGIEVIVSRAQPNVAMLLCTFTANFDGKVRAVVPIRNIHSGLSVLKSAYADIDGISGRAMVVRMNRKGEPFRGFGDLLLASYLQSEAESSRGWNRKRFSHYIDVAAKRDYKFMLACYTYIEAPNPHIYDLWGSLPKDGVPRDLPELERAVSLGMDFREQHIAAWAKLWEKDIIIEGPPRDQQALHSCMFYLLQSVREGSEWSIPPMGLSDNAFSGHVFWDADTWVFPALLLQHPDLARSVVTYRAYTIWGAARNAAASGHTGYEYAWESGETGLEDTPPGLLYRHARHINGDVALAQWQYYLATGDTDFLRFWGDQVIHMTAKYWVDRAVYVKEKDRYEIHQVVPPDENADLVNNSVYTNAIAKMNLEIADRVKKLQGAALYPEWREMASKLYIPYDAKRKQFIAHDHYSGHEAKQADTELLIYPLQFRIPGQDMTEVYRNTYRYYAPKVMPNGPAMTASAHSVIAARLGDREGAYAKFVESYKPFLRGPFNYFNEKRSRTWEKMCFLTGAAGPIQAALYGFAGIRMDYFPADPSKAELTFKPCLPKRWKSLKITGLQWQGRTFDLIVRPGDKVEIVNVGNTPLPARERGRG